MTRKKNQNFKHLSDSLSFVKLLLLIFCNITIKFYGVKPVKTETYSRCKNSIFHNYHLLNSEIKFKQTW